MDSSTCSFKNDFSSDSLLLLLSTNVHLLRFNELKNMLKLKINWLVLFQISFTFSHKIINPTIFKLYRLIDFIHL